VGFRSILVLDSYGTSIGGTQAAYRMVGASIDSALQIGNTFPVSDEPSSNRSSHIAINTIVRWGNYIYAWVNSTTQIRIYRYDVDTPSDDWVLYKTLTATTDSGDKHIKGGLYIMMLGGIPHLVGIASNGSPAYIGFKINLLTDTLNETSAFGSITTAAGVRLAIIYRNTLFVQSDTSRPYYYDPLTNATGQTGGAQVDTVKGTMVVYDGRLLWITPGTTAVIHELDFSTLTWGTTYTTDINTQDGSNTFNTSRWAAWVAPGNTNAGGQSLWLITNSRGPANSNPTWQLHEFFFSPTDIFTITDWTTTLPSNLINNAAGTTATASGSGKWRPFIDNETSPGNPAVNLFFSNTTDTGGVLSRYLFDHTGPSVTLLDTGAINSGWYQCPHDNTYGGGDRYWVPGQPTIRIMTHEPIGNGYQRITFIVSSPDPTSPVDVELYFIDNQEINITRGTLSDPTSGTIISDSTGDYISGVSADGATEHQVTWLASADGVSELEFAEIILRVVM